MLLSQCRWFAFGLFAVIFCQNVNASSPVPGFAHGSLSRLSGAIRPVQEDHPLYSDLLPVFRNLGPVFETDGWEEADPVLIWSSPSREVMSQDRAQSFCESIDARLPSEREFWALARALGARDPRLNHDLMGFNSEHLSWGFSRDFWSAASHEGSRNYGLVFSGYHGYLGPNLKSTVRAVICVR